MLDSQDPKTHAEQLIDYHGTKEKAHQVAESALSRYPMSRSWKTHWKAVIETLKPEARDEDD